MNRKFLVLGLTAASAMASAPAFATATPIDYSTLTGAIDVSTTITAILAVGAILVGIAVVTMGVRKFLKMVK